MPKLSSRQKRILDNARHAGELHLLYWIITVRRPLAESQGRTPMERERNRNRTASASGRVPALAVGDDPEVSFILAEILAEIVRVSDARAGGSPLRQYVPELTSIEVLNEVNWFHWGDEMLDLICPVCAGIISQFDCACVDKHSAGSLILPAGLPLIGNGEVSCTDSIPKPQKDARTKKARKRRR